MQLDNSLLVLITAGIVVFLGLLFFLWWRFRPASIGCREPLFSKEYRVLLGQIDIAVRSHLMVFPKVPIQDVFESSRSGGVLAKYKDKRFDFVICHRREMDVLCVIQMDKPGNQASNSSLRNLCDQAGLAMMVYDVKPYRDVPTLRREIFSVCGIDGVEFPVSNFEIRAAVDGKHSSASSQAEVPVSENMTTKQRVQEICPKCHSEMTLKTIRKGAHAGKQCWICNRYPDCKGAKMESA